MGWLNDYAAAPLPLAAAVPYRADCPSQFDAPGKVEVRPPIFPRSSFGPCGFRTLGETQPAQDTRLTDMIYSTAKAYTDALAMKATAKAATSLAKKQKELEIISGATARGVMPVVQEKLVEYGKPIAIIAGVGLLGLGVYLLSRKKSRARS